MTGALSPAAVPRGSLFRKYARLMASVIGLLLLANGAFEIWFLYRDHTELMARLQVAQAAAAAGKIEDFITDIEVHLEEVARLPWAAVPATERRQQALLALRRAPAISDIRLLDAEGRVQLHVSRRARDRVEPGEDLSANPLVIAARSGQAATGPVTFRRESEPAMAIAVAGTYPGAAIALAEVNLKLIWDVISQVRVGETGLAYIVDEKGRLLAHPDISLVLQNTSLAHLPQVQAAFKGAEGAARAGIPRVNAEPSRDLKDERVLSAAVAMPHLQWWVFAEVPMREAYAPLLASLERTGLLLLVGIGVAMLAAMYLARRMAQPIRQLQAGAARIGAGDLGATVAIRTGDELEALADQFNGMSAALRDSREREERLGRLRRFLSPQLAGVIESSGDDAILKSHRREVAVVFCDMRGFTAFAESTSPDEVMRVLHEYHEGLGRLIHKFEGTLERFVGDGALILFNDPLPCPDPALRAVHMAIEMQAAMAQLCAKWQTEGYSLGFGIGITFGAATLGPIGFEGRHDYSAIGSVVNLAARLCGEARHGQILVDAALHDLVRLHTRWEAAGSLALKGINRPVPVFNIVAFGAVN